MATLRGLDDNSERLERLEAEKIPYTFSCENLLELISFTNSIKTKIAVIEMICPRVIDPNAKKAEILEKFQYAADKQRVEAAIKDRADMLVSRRFSANPSNLLQISPTAGGIGAGGAGRRPSPINLSLSLLKSRPGQPFLPSVWPRAAGVVEEVI